MRGRPRKRRAARRRWCAPARRRSWSKAASRRSCGLPPAPAVGASGVRFGRTEAGLTAKSSLESPQAVLPWGFPEKMSVSGWSPGFASSSRYCFDFRRKPRSRVRVLPVSFWLGRRQPARPTSNLAAHLESPFTMITFRCPGCNARIKAPGQLLGHSRPCPGCGTTLYIHRRPPPDAAPLLVNDRPSPTRGETDRR
jgi:hypothetical protein